MNKTLIACAIAALLAGCGTQHIKVVTVDKPIPMIPAPPMVPECDYKVDKLTDADATNYGTVGEAYKYDMTCARATNSMLRQIIKAYKDAAESAKPVVDEINAAFGKMQRDIDAAQEVKKQ